MLSYNTYRYFFVYLVLFVSAIAYTPFVIADEIVMPTCINPSGNIIASYQSGVHGVAGDTYAYEGADVVYKIQDSNYLQCLCTNGGMGIQTKWTPTEQLSDPEIQKISSEGFVYIPDGSMWGLDPHSFLAQNSTYSCIGGKGGGGGDSSKGSSSDNSSSTSNSSNSSSSSTTSSYFAPTGNIPSILAFMSYGIAALMLGNMFVRRSESE